MESGDILILNNHKVVHGRSAFSPLFNGHDRFVIRSFIMKNINKILIKYEDVEKNRLETFSKILNFVNKLMNKGNEIDTNKLVTISEFLSPINLSLIHI